jgi:hypothetical protein
MFKPTIWGMMVDERAQVLITTFCWEALAASTFFNSFSLTAGPFLTDLDILPTYLDA